MDYYKKSETASDTFTALYYDWLLTYKVLEASKATIERLHTSFRKYYAKSTLADKPIKQITPLMLKTFLMEIISRENLNYRAYSAIATIPRQLFDYCVESELLTENPMDKVKIKKNSFRHDKKPAAETQVFTEEEKQLLEDLILKEFEANPNYGTTGLALILLFQTGLRSGEAVSLQPTDIRSDYLTVERTETSYSTINVDGTKSPVIYDVKEFPKTADSNRDIPLSETAKHLLKLVINRNQSHGYGNSKYLFINEKGERIIRKRLDTTIRRYCKIAKIPPRSCHKIRKTFVSTLIDTSGISNDEVRKIAGHSDLAITNSCYVYNRNPASQTLNVLNEVL